MRIGLTAKLFLAVLLACATVMVVQSAAMRITFQQGFIGYLNEQGRQSMQESLPLLAATYREHGSWDFLRSDFRNWIDLIRPLASETRLPSITEADQTGAMVRMGLLDAQLQRVAGNPRVGADSLRLPVVVDGHTVGWIAMVPFEKALAPGEARFIEQYRRSLTAIAIISVVVVALLTFLVTRTLLRRVRTLTQATHTLASGDYTTRIAVGPRDELGSLAQDFNRMAQALEHNERSRRTFMADISHELRTPLAVVRAEIEAIQDGIRPAGTQSLEVMHQEIGRLGQLIDDLYDLSLTDAGAMAYRHESVDLAMVLRTILGNMQGRLDAAGLHLQTVFSTGPLIVVGDERRLQQLFANLMENSLRYTDTGGTVRVHCAGLEVSAMIVIEDSAPGVPVEKLEHLFERFYRVDASRNRASGGSGLGLAICRNIVEAHGGRIAPASSPLGGLSISIELPLAAS